MKMPVLSLALPMLGWSWAAPTFARDTLQPATTRRDKIPDSQEGLSMQRSRLNNRRALRRIVVSSVLFCSTMPEPVSAQTLGTDRLQIKGPLTVAQAVQTGLQE